MALFPPPSTLQFASHTLKVMVKGEVVVDRSDLDPLIRQRQFLLPMGTNTMIAPSKKNIAYGDPFRGLVADFYMWNRYFDINCKKH